MRPTRIALGGFVLAAAGLLGASGCRDATEVTVEISLSERASCAEVHGTAITVGVDPNDTEKRVAQEFVSASTTACDQASRSIGTLVVTPSDQGGASVVVVVAYAKDVTAASCKPPYYAGCIVARRHFGFSSHQQLHMPITIDPSCEGVPCDAFSTCRTGMCFTSEVACQGQGCSEPGATPDGGTSEAGVLTPETGSPDGTVPLPDGALPLDGAIDAPLDSPLDGPLLLDGSTGDAAALGPTRCNPPGGAGTLVCGSQSCAGATNYCCGASVAAAVCQNTPCAGPRYCCDTSDCAGGLCPTAVAPLPNVPNLPNLPNGPKLAMMPLGGTVATCGLPLPPPPLPPPPP